MMSGSKAMSPRSSPTTNASPPPAARMETIHPHSPPKSATNRRNHKLDDDSPRRHGTTEAPSTPTVAPQKNSLATNGTNARAESLTPLVLRLLRPRRRLPKGAEP